MIDTPRTHRLRFVALAAGVALLGVGACDPPPVEDGSQRSAADSVARDYAAAGRWHGGLLVASGDSVVFRGASGLADRESGEPNSADLRYDIYSISKSFTAIVILQLVEAGRLSLDGTLADYLPEYRGPGAGRITIHQLLSHTSGVPDYITAMPGYLDAPFELSRDSLLAWAAAEPLEFDPGEGFGYSNTGYALLGWMIEVVTEQPFDEALEERIFGPLGMTRTEWSAHPMRAEGVALTYGGDQVAPIERIQPGEGGIVSTLDDMHRFARALGSTDLLSPASWELAFTPHGDPERALREHPAHRVPYGYGFSLSTIERADGTTVRIAEHGGAGFGGSTMLQREIDGDGIILLWNNVSGLVPSIPELTDLVVASDVAIRGTTVVDVTRGALLPDQTVLIRGNRIAAVGPTDEIGIAADAVVIDADGTFLIPGLWDTHVHSVRNGAVDGVTDPEPVDWHFPLFLAYGITGVRNMNDATADVTLALARSVRQRLDAGDLRGPPRFLTAGPSLDGDPPLGANPVVVRTPAEARSVVDALADAGADFVKPYENLSPDVYFALLDQARRRGLPVYGHLPFRVTLEEAAVAGQRTIEHPDAMAAGCSADAEAVRERFAQVLSDYESLPADEQFLVQFRLSRAFYDTRDPAACTATIEALLRHDVAVAPDLVAYHDVVHAEEVLADTSMMRLVPEAVRREWEAMAADETTSEFQAILRPILPLELANVRLFGDAGVTLLAATDVGVPFQVPGIGLHRDLVRLTEAGLTPLEALQAATLNPARVLSLVDSLGTIEEGKLADLVLLDANPLDDIRHTQRIRAVIADGRIFGRGDLDRLRGQEPPTSPAPTRSLEEALVVPNDNRTPAGTLRDGVLELDLEARPARWEGERSDLDPDAANPTVVDVLGFAEEGGSVTIPGPLIRVPQGTEVRVRVRNSIPEGYPIGLPLPATREPGMRSLADDVLVVRGLRAGTAFDDVLRVPRGEVAEVRYRADVPGTYFYWATPSSRPITAWTGRDAQLAGAIIVDPEGTAPDPDERIFVITILDQYADPDAPSPQGEYLRRAINGRSWPDTERFDHTVGETVRWRWINASFEVHPMHLHGFHYRLVARGDGTSETLHPENARPLIVTEHMAPGGTFRMEWVPTRAGHWIFHCHILDHIVPAVERDETAREHDLMDVEQHALDAMAGLILGMTVTEDGPAGRMEPPHQRLRLLALETLKDDGTAVRGFALGAGMGDGDDAPSVPGPPLLLTRGQTTEITVVNRLSEPTTIHWHGMELESVFDGVAGWSRTGSRIAPLVAPGDSFAVRITPPRAGTFIYHTHMDETDQLAQGMIGPLLVLEPGEAYDPEHDRVFLVSGQADGGYPVTLNGQLEPTPATFRVGEEYRLRFIQITRGVPVDIALTRNGSPVRWRALAKDGADLPEALRLEGDAAIRTNTGETFDFLWTPAEPGEVTLSVRYERFFEVVEIVLRQTLFLR